MPTMHFAFGGLHRKGDLSAQVEAFKTHILSPKTLRAFICPEFHPIITSPHALVAHPDATRAIGGGGVALGGFVPAPPVMLLPIDVWMISFVTIQFTKLNRWPGLSHYGRLGLAFTDDFVRRQGIRRVHYYQYPNLARDPLVIKLNQTPHGSVEHDKLASEVIEYRKPARLWSEINGLFAAMRLTADGDGGVDIEKLTYSRYDVGYDFEAESEARKVMSENQRDLSFAESDVVRVIAPDAVMAEALGLFLKNHWTKPPPVLVVPAM